MQGRADCWLKESCSELRTPSKTPANNNDNQRLSHFVTNTLSHIEQRVTSMRDNGMSIITDSIAVVHNGITFL